MRPFRPRRVGDLVEPPSGRAQGLAIRSDDPFREVVFDYAHNLLVGSELRDMSKSDVEELAGSWLLHGLMGVEIRRCRSVTGLTAKVSAYQSAHPEGQRRPRAPSDPIAANVAVISKVVGLDDAETAIFTFLLTSEKNRSLGAMIGRFGVPDEDAAISIIATATSVAPKDVRRALDSSAALRSSGIVETDNFRAGEDLSEFFSVPRQILGQVTAPGLDAQRFIGKLVPEVPAPAVLDLDDFQHLSTEVSTARDLLAAALCERRPGINLLLYGPTGTGKTSVAALLAKQIGARLFAAGGADEEGSSADARERLSSLRLGQRLLRSGNAALLFDEIEDLFSLPPGWPHRHRSAGISKAWFNTLLETNAVPTFWITNSVDGIDAAYLRRFTYVIEFRPLGPAQRARALARHLGPGTDLDAAQIHSIAARYPVSPAHLGTAVNAAKLLAKGDEPPSRETIERVLAPAARLATGVDPRRHVVFEPTAYRLDALHSDANLEDIADRLARFVPGAGPGLSLCLYGPPGTGKTEFAKYLAHRMGRSILARRASDILSMWVGESEKAIAAAFREAEQDDAVLLFDEVDSFLRDRTTAVRSWEVTQTNEFLTQLETFRGVVVCTTNLWKDLDEASLRRFVFKVEFRFLKVNQAVALFRTMFGEWLGNELTDFDAHLERSLGEIPRLTPGDFAAVLRRERTLGGQPSVDALVTALVAEVRAKGASVGAAGFR